MAPPSLRLASLRLTSGLRLTSDRLSRHRTLFVATVVILGAGVFAAPAVLGGIWTGDGISPITEVPNDNRQLGLVYEGLTPAKRGTECVGAYEVVTRGTCTHGPDEAPAGLDVQRDVEPVARVTPVSALPRRDVTRAPRERDLAADEGAVEAAEGVPALVPEAAVGTAPTATAPGGVPCDGDGISGKRVQALYVYEAGTASRYSRYLASFRTWAAAVDAIVNASARQTGGTRHLRYVTTPDCQVDVAEVQVAARALDTFNATISALKDLGYDNTDRKYLLFSDSKVYCGIGTFVADGSPGGGNRNNRGPSYARADAGCWGASVAAHELSHSLGAVLSNAPNASRGGHCTDDYDVMCYKDAKKTKLRVVCPERASEQRLDCNNDDYFSTDPKPGSFLATHWNVANSDFLVGAGAGEGAPARPEPAAKQKPAGSATKPAPTDPPAPDPSDDPATKPTKPADDDKKAPPVVGPVRAIDSTSTSTRLSWASDGPRIRYTVLVDGRRVGSIRAVRARLIGLQPNTTYRIEVAVPGADGGLRVHAGPAVVRTAPAARPDPGTVFQLTNALTGGLANLYGARDAAGTPLVLGRPEGVASQRWELEPAAGGAYRLRSKATGKCAAPLGAVAAGAVVVQQNCSGGDAGQVWRLGLGSSGFTLRAGSGPLVLGVSRLRYGGQRLLVLQRPIGARYQSWTALPV